MAYRMACEHADQIAGIVSLAGAMYEDPSTCKPSAPVSVLQIHGTSDTEVLYDGFAGASSPGNGPYPSAATTTMDWATLDGCSLTADASSPNIDIDATIPGAETTVLRYDQGCQGGAEVDLWSIQNGPHVPDVNMNFREGIVSFMLAHPKP